MFRTRVALVGLLMSGAAVSQQYVISTVAGGAPIPTPIAATGTSIGQPRAVAAGPAGVVYFAGYGSTVYKIDAGGILTRLAGNGRSAFSGDGGPATSAQLSGPDDMAVDNVGNLYLADSGRIRKVSTNGIITTIAGNGSNGYSGDGGQATNAQLSFPRSVTVDNTGNLYIGEFGRIRKIAANGIITTVAGDGTISFGFGSSGDGGPATSAQLSAYAVAVDAAGNLYIADGSRIRKVATNGIVTTVAGNGSFGYSGDGGPATNAKLDNAQRLAVDGAGNLFLADLLNYRIRKVAATGVITTIAGNGSEGYSGDGGPATNAQLLEPTGLALDSAGHLYVSEFRNNLIRRVAANGLISRFAGDGTPGYAGDGGEAIRARLTRPYGLALDAAGNLYIADGINSCIRKVAANGIITTFAGNGSQGYSGDGSLATGSQLFGPLGVAVDTGGNLYIVDGSNYRIRKVATNGVITTVAGNGSRGYSGDGGLAASAQLVSPIDVAVDTAGNLYIADSASLHIRKVATNGVITTVAGNGTRGQAGDGGPAANAQLSPSGVAVDSAGNLYISDGNRIRKMAANGIITTIAGTGSQGYSGDGGPATSAQLSGAKGVAVDASGNVYIADTGNNAIRLLTPMPAPLTASVSVNAASNLAGPLAPGEIVVLYGSGIGPAQLTVAGVDNQGIFGTNLSGTRVLFNGIPGPMIYTSLTQVSAIVPYSVSGTLAGVQIEYQGTKTDPIPVSLMPSIPALFTVDSTGKGQAAAFNEDGSLNSSSKPAKVGGIVVLYATGEGQTSPGGVDGKPATAPLPKPLLAVQVTIDGKPAEVIYAGGAPGLVAGLMQVNVRIPAGAQVGIVPVVITVGSASSPSGVTIAVSGN